MLIGAAPEIFLAACASIPPDADELAVANAVAGKALAVTPCETIGLSVPADTQIVIEGRILPHERRPEGPFGEFMGYYVPEEAEPCLRGHDGHGLRRPGLSRPGLRLAGRPDPARNRHRLENLPASDGIAARHRRRVLQSATAQHGGQDKQAV